VLGCWNVYLGEIISTATTAHHRYLLARNNESRHVQVFAMPPMASLILTYQDRHHPSPASFDFLKLYKAKVVFEASWFNIKV
jgi:hypothetical protein